MLVSQNQLKSYLPELSNDPEIVRLKMTKALAEIESYTKTHVDVTNLVVGEVLKVYPHPESKKLKVAEVDISSGINEEKEVVTIVCGAPNLEVSQKVVVVKPGGKVYDAHLNEMTLFTVEKRSVAGIESCGMICSARELGLGEDHDGILVLPNEYTVGTDLNAKDIIVDIVYEIENKTISHRSDCFSHRGIARELKSIFNLSTFYNITHDKLNNVKAKDLPLQININTTLCSRFTAIIITNIEVKPSPLWLQRYLNNIGIRPINNIVDITNYIMTDLGQPMHAFDYEKLDKKQLNVRNANKDEIIATLDGKEHVLNTETVVIADGENPTSIAGIMGGLNSEISDNTKTIVLEAATWDMFNIRRTSRNVGIRTEASMRFEKGLDTELTMEAVVYATNLIQDLAGGDIASEIFDIYPNPIDEKIIELDVNRMNRILGINISRDEVLTILNSLNINTEHAAYVKVDGVNPILNTSYINLVIPSYRKDLKIQEDIYEEVARIYGYDKFIPTAPSRSNMVPEKNIFSKAERKIKIALVDDNFEEMFGYSFVSKEMWEKANLNIDNILRLTNPLNPDVEYIRDDLLPSLLSLAEKNTLKYNYDNLSYFEYNRVTYKNLYLESSLSNDKGLHLQPWILGMVNIDKGIDTITNSIKHIISKFDVSYSIENFTNTDNFINVPNVTLFHPGKSAVIMIKSSSGDMITIGAYGQLHPKVNANYKFKNSLNVYIASINIDKLLDNDKVSESSFKTISDYQTISRDITVNLDKFVSVSHIQQKVKDLNISEIDKVETIDRFQKNEKIAVTLRLYLRRYDKDISTKEIDEIIGKVETLLSIG